MASRTETYGSGRAVCAWRSSFSCALHADRCHDGIRNHDPLYRRRHPHRRHRRRRPRSAASASTGQVYRAGPTRGCGTVGGWTVAAGKTTTTCGLARSAARDFLARVDDDRIEYGDASPRRITGYSAKRGRSYRLENMGTTVTTSRMTASYEGHAGAATLLVRISTRL